MVNLASRNERNCDPIGIFCLRDLRKNYDRVGSFVWLVAISFLLLLLGAGFSFLRVFFSMGAFFIGIFAVFFFVWYQNNK